MRNFKKLMDYVASFVKGVSQTRACQWTINKMRENIYPWVYNKWEANCISEDSNIWLGGLASACDREALRKKKIGRIVSAVYDCNPIFPDDPELLYLKVPVIDKPTADIAKHFDRAIEFIHDGVQKKQGILIHCVYGISRSSTLVCAYLIKKHNMNVKQAIAHVKKCRPDADPNSGFLVQLQTFGAMPVNNYNFGGFVSLDD